MAIDDSPGLGVDFAINTEGAFSELLRFAQMFDDKTVEFVRQAAKVEQAIGGAIVFKGASAKVKAFADSTQGDMRVAKTAVDDVARATDNLALAATRTAGISIIGPAETREAGNATRAINATATAIDRRIIGLEREAAAIGLTKAELRAKADAELVATAATQGNADAADRLYAAIKNRDNLIRSDAEDRHAAAMRAEAEAASAQAAAIARGNAELMERARLQAALDRTNGTDRSSARDSGATFSALAAKAAEDEARAIAAAGAAAAQAAREHDLLAAAVRGSHAAQVADAQAAEQLRLATDPLYAATSRLNAEIAESTRLYHAGATAPGEYARQQEVLTGRLRQSMQAHNEMEGAVRKSGGALKNIAVQLPDITQGLLTGQKPMQVLIQQGAQIFQVAQMAEGGLKGFAGEVGGLAVAFLPAIAAASVAGVALYRWKEQIDQDAGMKKFADGLGLTHKEMKKLGDVSVTTGDIVAGVWKTISDGLNAGGSGKSIMDYLFSPDDAQQVQGFLASIYGTFTGTYAAIVELWSSISTSVSAYVSAAAVAVAQFFAPVVAAAEWAGNGIGQIFSAIYNRVAGWLKSIGSAISDFAGPILKAMGQTDAAVAVTSAGSSLGKAFGKGYAQGAGQVVNGTNKFFADSAQNAIERAQANAVKKADAIKADRTPKKDPVDKHAESLIRDAEAVEAQIRNLYKLADAYGVSGAAALIAEARVKAESKAIKQQADIEAAVDRQVRLAIAQRVSDAAKSTAGVREQAIAQAAVNAQVAAGLVPAARASEMVRDQLADLPLLAAIEAARSRGLVTEADRATKALGEQRTARAALTKAERDAQFATEMATGKDRLDELREELRLVGATDAARERALGTLRATQEAQTKFAGDPDKQAAYIKQQMEIVDGTIKLRSETDAYNASLTATGDLFDTLDQSAQSAASGISDAFGRVGTAVGDALTIVTGFYADQARLQEQHAAAIKSAGTDEIKIARENQLFAIRSSSQQISAFGNMASAAKGFFKEGSGGYQAMAAAEKVYRVAQLAMSVAAIIQNGAETVASTANAAARATADGTAGIAAQAKLPFPANIAAMAATGAALVAAGIAVFGGGGGGSAAPSVKTSEDYQKAQGTGSVLGDASAKSESIANALDLMMKNSNRDLEYSSSMVQSLRAIESGIGNLAAAVARETKVGGGLDASSLALGTNTGGGLLGIGGLFSKSITRELNDAGLQFDGASVASVIASGITANLYQEVLKTTKKSGFLGIGGSTKTSVETVRTGADAGLTSEVSLLINSMRTAIVDAAGTIGIDGATAMLDAFQINIGRISLKGLTSDEIEAELAAVFSRVGDDMASAIGGGLSSFQRAGEGMLETLVRLAKEYTTVDVTLRSIGMTFGAIGLSSVGARTALVELFGGLDEFTEQTGFFRENFLSEAEQMAPVIASVREEMNRLGLSGVVTKDAFKSVVLGLDLSSASGRETYAALMSVAPAFAKTSDYLASLTGELQDTAKTAEQLAAIEKQRRGLDIQLMEATGNAAGALAAKRADDLAGMDETLRALQQQVWGAQDAAQAARDLAAAEAEVTRAATALATQRRGLEIDLMEAIGNSAGALAAKRADEIAALDASLRPLKDQIYAAQDAAAANAALAEAQNATAEAAQQLADQRRSLEIGLMEAIGDAAGASAAKRADELAAIDATLRPLQEAIYAAQDAAAAQTALADAQAEAAQSALASAQQRRGLEIQLMEATGDASAALNAKRSDELAALDVGLRALQQQVWAAQDAAAANAALAEAQQSAAQAAVQAAAQIAQQRAALQISLLRAQGMEGQAVNAERELQLAATDESLRALQAQVWAAEDARAAAEAASQAQAAYAQQQQQMANDAEQLRKQQAGMQAQLLDLLGNAAGATALRRQEELVALDASLRPLQQSIWAQEDLAAAATAAADRVSAARDTLTDSYKRESDALQETIDKFADFGDGLRKYRAELGNGSDATVDAYRAAQARFVDTSALAAKGDAGALGELEAISKDFLTASRERAGSLADYQRDVARVAGSVDRAIGASDEAVDYAKAQLDALKASVGSLIEIDESVVSVRDAILALQVAIAGNPPAPTKVPDAPASATAASSQPVQVNTAELERRIDALSARLEVQNTAVAENTGKMSRMMDRWDGGGLLVRSDDDTPLHVTSADA